jgi:uncharacterized protein (DUF1778 family)
MTIKEKPKGKSSRLEARVSPDALAMVKCAAQIRGRTVSDVVVADAQEAAQRTIESTQIMRLSLEGQQQFAEAILNPSPPSARLKRTAACYRQLIREVR